jgi:two-component system CheB/CheR fusion protein
VADQVSSMQRRVVLFAAHNILRDPPFSRLHLISCRNLLIYLNRDIQERVFEMFHFSLVPGGYLFLGSAESADVASNYFVPVDKKNRIYQAIGTQRRVHYIPTAPFRKEASTLAIAGKVREENPRIAYAQLHQELLQQYAPPSLLVNRDGDIAHVSGNAGRYLQHTAGEPSHNLVDLIIPELRLELRTALFQTMQSAEEQKVRAIQVERGGQIANVSMTLRLVGHERLSGELILILFNESEPDSVVEHDPETRMSGIVDHLEKELFATKERLQSTIEQYETSAEELKASNEELQAINEELRSTTEELETSKEEMQSINEELLTVNHELKIKVDETAKSNDDLHNFIVATEIATIFVDRSMRIKRYTSRVKDIFNLIDSDIGRPLLDINHCLRYDALEQDADEVFHTLRTMEREVESTNGKQFIARLIPYRTTEDRIDGLVLTFIDMTSLHNTQKKLAAEEQRMRLVAASTQDYAIITQDCEGRITSWNGGAERIFGYSEEEMLGEKIDVIFTPEDRANGAPIAELAKALKDGRAEDDRWHLRKDGTRFYCGGVVTRLEDGEIRGFAKIARDLTGVKEAEKRNQTVLAQEKLIRAEAETAARLREEFLAILSHELKQPLNLIHLNAELLRRLPEFRDSEKVKKIAETIRNSAISQATLINDLLDLSRVNTGKLKLNKERINIVTVLDNIATAFQDDAAKKHIRLRNETSEQSIVVSADSTRLEQIIWNLLSNAIKFTQDGGEITVSLTKYDGSVCLSVKDNGKGIEPQYLPFLFEMFNQAESSTTREHGGLGIGLALVKQLAESHGGYVQVQSDGTGHGAIFSVYLPLPAQPMTAEQISNLAADISIVKDKQILLVDDDYGGISAFAEILISHGAHLVCADSADQALDLLSKSKFDLIVSDIAMPGKDGYALMAEIQRNGNDLDTPVIALTGFGRLIDVERALKAGFSAHLQKPVNLDAFAKTVALTLKVS